MVTTVDHKLAEFAIKKTCEAVKHDKVLVFSNKRLELPFSHSFAKITSEFTRPDWQNFIIKDLYKYVDTDHALIIQPDGFGVHSSFWNDDFLLYDFLAAPFCTEMPVVKETIQALGLPANSPYLFDPMCVVGGGGMSLRSKRLLEITSKEQFQFTKTVKTLYDLDGWRIHDRTVSEDISLSIFYRDTLENDYKLKFGSVDLALNFSNEDVATGGYSFGFHGWGYAPLYLNYEECKFYMENMKKVTEENIAHPNYRKLLASLIRMGYNDLFNQLSTELREVAVGMKNA